MAINFQYQDASTVRVLDLMDGTLSEMLKPAIYRVVFNKFTGFFLEKEYDVFKVPAKVYGNVTRKAGKIINTYKDRDRSTGILLTGDKGSGKTMLAEVVCNQLIGEGVPVIMITERFVGSDFTSFIDSLGVIVLFFDEFGKTYPPAKDYNEEVDTQESLLSLMDGGSRQRRLVILTENRDSDINEFMRSRPGRIYYHLKYDKLEEATIKEYLKDQVTLEAEIADYIVDASRKMRFFSFDILQAIVEEYLRYGGGLDGIEEVLNDLNIDYDKDSTIRLEVIKLVKKEGNEEVEVSYSSKYLDKPHSSEYFSIFTKGYDEFRAKENHDDDDCANNYRINFRGYQLVYDSKDRMVYDNEEYILVAKISDVPQYKFNYAKL